MTIENLSINNSRTAIILGAGASRGASCFENTIFQAPLDTDFFKICQVLMHFKPDLENLIEFVRDEFSPTLNHRMEEVFTSVEALDLFFETTKFEKGPRVRKYEKIMNSYSYYLSLVFSTLSEKIDSSGELSCIYHDKLVGTLDGNDAIISFNYDTIIESSLKRVAKKKWNPKKGYGFEIKTGIKVWCDHSGKGRVAAEGISLLKLHGSLNWKRLVNENIALRPSSYEINDRTKDEIVPPVWNKRLGGDSVLNSVWKQARIKLRGIRTLVVIGYSLPATDALTQSLLKVSLAENNEQLENIIVVNPDPNIGDRILSIAAKKAKSTTQFIQYKSLSEFIKTI